MRVAIGLIISPGFRAETDFWMGRPDKDRPCGTCGRDLAPHTDHALGHPFAPQAEGFFAIWQRLQTGEANRVLKTPVTGLSLVLSRLFPTDVARNEVCANFLASDADWLLFLDTDMVHPATIAERLIAAEKSVITARYHLKKAPFSTIAYVKHRTQLGAHRYASVHFGRGVFEIERGGAGALLIHRDVLTAVRTRQQGQWNDYLSTVAATLPDWLRHGYLPRRPTTQWFRYQYDLPDGDKRVDMNISEDFWFFQQAREAGFSCWIDWDLVCQHLGLMPIDDSWNRPFLHTQMTDHENPDLRDLVVNNTIVCGYPEGLYLGAEGDAGAVHIPEYRVTGGER